MTGTTKMDVEWRKGKEDQAPSIPNRREGEEVSNALWGLIQETALNAIAIGNTGEIL